jgi:hypothetical protein
MAVGVVALVKNSLKGTLCYWRRGKGQCCGYFGKNTGGVQHFGTPPVSEYQWRTL